jgi:hypothetical protein
MHRGRTIRRRYSLIWEVGRGELERPRCRALWGIRNSIRRDKTLEPKGRSSQSHKTRGIDSWLTVAKLFEGRSRPYPRSSNYTFHSCARTSIRTSDEISVRRRALEIGCMPAKWPSDRGKPASRVYPPKAPLGGLKFSACYRRRREGTVEADWNLDGPWIDTGVVRVKARTLENRNDLDACI